MINPDEISELLKETAQTYILPRFQALQAHEISSKTGPRDLVTQADIESEAFLSEVLPGKLPGSVVIGEEGISSGQTSLDALADPQTPVWVVDPVDGTYNFVHGKPQFGIMLALVVNGHTQWGWIYNILADEMALAEQGGGAYMNGVALHVAPSDTAKDMSGFINPRFFHKDDHDHIAAARETLKSVRSLGCAAHEYLGLVKGEDQFSIYNKLKPWDHLPGALILQEAGGYIAKWDDEPYLPQDDRVGLIAAASKENWQYTYDTFVRGMKA